MSPASPAAAPGPAGLARADAPGPWALRLGYGGLLPFVGGAVLVWAVRPDVQPYAVLALAAYAATIVSFLGGIHWGLAMRHAEPPPSLLAWGVVPPLVAWPAAMMPGGSALVIHGAMLVACYAVDRRVYPREGAAGWLALRFRLSAVAAASCFLGAAGA